MKKAGLDLCYLTATEAIEQFDSKTLSPVDVVKAQIVRNEEAEPESNATTYMFVEEALKQARGSDRSKA